MSQRRWLRHRRSASQRDSDCIGLILTALVVFDIEAVPDLEAARRLLGQPDHTPDADIRRMLGERYSRDGADPATAFLKVPIYRIVSIAALYAKREDGGGPWTVTKSAAVRSARKPKRNCCSASSKAFRSMVGARAQSCDLLAAMASTYRCCAIGPSPSAFPYRAFTPAVTATIGTASARTTIDLCDVAVRLRRLKQAEPRRDGGVGQHSGEDRRRRWQSGRGLRRSGRLTEVTDYCLTDVLATYSVFLRYEMVRGELRPAHFDASMESLRAIVQRHLSNGR